MNGLGGEGAVGTAERDRFGQLRLGVEDLILPQRLEPFGLGGKEGAWAYANLGVLFALVAGLLLAGRLDPVVALRCD